MLSKFHDLLAERSYLVADGATGTNLFGRGLETGYPPELWNVERPDDILWLHDSFLNAGSNLILTNSFGGTSYRLKLHEAQDRVEELNHAAAVNAVTAVTNHRDKTGNDAIVAGSIGPTGELFEPLGALTASTAFDAFKKQATALAEGGVDMLWVETMSATEEVDAAVNAAKTTGLPVAVTMTFDTASRTMMGITPAQFARQALALGADVLGANCGIGPAELMHSMAGMTPTASAADIPMVAKGNCGIPAYVEGAIHYHGTPELMASYALFARDAGISIIGGCCGTTPEHVAAMSAALASRPAGTLDEDEMLAVLGTPWADVQTSSDATSDNAGDGGRRGRRGRRRS
ncbi:MAG: betaine--homocysteine S-methyltransferase [Candidatus Puniceispirillum sp.]